jgi:Anti-sigma-K factor rskA/Putative zinc-finger
MTDIHESAGAYALNALDAAELAEFEAHLATCETCQSEVAELCAIAAELSLMSLADPPATLRDNTLAAITDAPQLPADDSDPRAGGPVTGDGIRAAADSRRVVRAGGPRRALPGTEVPEELQERPVDEVAVRRQRRRNRILTGVVAAMLALVVGLGGVIYVLVQERQASVAQVGLEQQLYEAPDTTFTTRDLRSGGKVTFVSSAQLNRAMFVGTDLPDPGADSRYQLWTMTGPEPRWVVASSISRDVQITDTEPTVKVFFTGNIAGADFLCVNVEPAGSTSERPTVPPLASAPV